VKYLRPFFCYYGGKWRAAPRYPAPIHETIIEPFAGAAGYSCRHYTKKVILYDLDPLIAGLWHYLIHTPEEEILNLPTTITHLDDMQLTQEQKWLIGFWVNKAGTTPKKSPSRWMRDGLAPNSWWGDAVKNRIATQLPYIRHWQIHNKPYHQSPNIEATWFIDPPYNNNAGNKYTCKFTDYPALTTFCQSRQGQTIVCEQAGATWLPFQELGHFKSTEGARGKARSAEAIWLNS
jgi:hypothetical protein